MLTFTERQIRNEKKREKNAVAMYIETDDVSYMRKADECKRKWIELERNQKVDLQKKMSKEMKKNMTEDEAFQEAQEYNLRMKLEGEEKKRLQMEKEANLKELRMKSRSLLKEKREQKKKADEKKQSLMVDFNKTQENHKAAFFEKMKKENPKMSHPEIQKKFRRYQLDREKREEYKRQIKFVFTLKGIEESEIDKKIDEYFDYLREEKQKFLIEQGKNKKKNKKGKAKDEEDDVFPLDFELDDYIEGYDEKMIEEKVSDLEEPIAEENVETQASL